MEISKRTRKFSYHWVIFAIGFLMVFFALGFGSSTRGTYLAAITGQTGMERGVYSISDTCRFLSTAILNFFFGTLVAKFGARRLVGAGFLSLTLSCVVNALATSPWHFYLGGCLLGVGFAWTTTTIVGVVVEKWFAGNKGTVMGVILAANGLGAALSEVVITPIIFGANEQIPDSQARWRLAYWITAALFLCVGLLAVIFLRNDPADCGLAPLGGEGRKKKKKRNSDWDGFTMDRILKKPYFYLTGACVFFTGLVLQSMHSISKPAMYDAGLSKEYVIVVFSTHALALTVSKILAGGAFDRFGIRFTYGYCSLAAMFSLFALLLTGTGSFLAQSVFPFAYSLLSAVALPLETIIIPLLVTEIFGRACHAKIMGYYLGLNIMGYAVGGPIANFAYDYLGNYHLILILFAGTMFFVALAIQATFLAARRDRISYLNSMKKESRS